MSDFREDIKKSLLEKRKLSDSTLRTYSSVLYNVADKLGEKHLGVFSEQKSKVLEYVTGLEKPQTRKTILSALFVLTGEKDYQDKMKEDIDVVNKHYSARKMDAKREEKKIPFEQVKEINAKLLREHQSSPYDREKLQNYVISMLCSGEHISPRRLLDWISMKTKNYDKKTENYILGNKFYFNKYKTSRLYGLQTIDIPPNVKAMINKLKKLNPPTSDYLLNNRKGEPLTSSGLNKLLTSIYGFSVDMLRSIFLTDEVYDNDLLKKLEKTAMEMGHSVEAQKMFYVKDNHE